MLLDAQGLPTTTASPAAMAAYDATIASYLASGVDTGRHLRVALTADADMPMAVVMRGYFHRLMAEAAQVPQAQACLDRAELLAPGATPRERMHVEALRRWCAEDLRGAVAVWEAILVEHKRDVVAARLAHHMHFFLGDAAAMRDSAARVLPAWTESDPAYGFLLGLHAFGLEETGDYAGAERRARRAVELNRHDVWSGHCVAHVMEMQGRHREGIAWISQHEAVWSRANNFTNHLWWHRALYYLELGDHAAVLDSYDRLFRHDRSADALDMCNAIAMLLRLDYRGVDVGDRWTELADLAETRIDDHQRPFNDVHFAAALALAGRGEALDRLQRGKRAFAAASEAVLAGVMREVSIPVGDAIAAYAAGDHAGAVACLLPVRNDVYRIGGSHAQRDLFAQMLIESALRSGQAGLARKLLAERVRNKPTSAPSWHGLARAHDILGDAAAAAASRARADALILPAADTMRLAA